MLALTILSIFILIVISIIIYEVKSEKNYQDKRRRRRDGSKDKTTQKFPSDPIVPSERHKNRAKRKEKISQKEPLRTLKTEPVKNKQNLPVCKYPKFTHVRLVDMGLSNEEAKEFVEELIPQLETHVSLIEDSLEIPDFHQMERLTHGLKGSATNLGTGGISDLLIECNTYLKTGTDIDIATAYVGYLKHYTQELKEQYA